MGEESIFMIDIFDSSLTSQVILTSADFSELLSAGKPATQSSTGWGGVAGRAVDGNRNANYFGNSCSHTQIVHGAWWEVNLGAFSRIDKVVITNRADCCCKYLNLSLFT